MQSIQNFFGRLLRPVLLFVRRLVILLSIGPSAPELNLPRWAVAPARVLAELRALGRIDAAPAKGKGLADRFPVAAYRLRALAQHRPGLGPAPVKVGPVERGAEIARGRVV